ncbi:MAG: helix-turn-helix domain-containing protein [Anaerolineales bacterium]|nr:helix-turn-helix domain-containing protein [Anaerolineales bacterium]
MNQWAVPEYTPKPPGQTQVLSTGAAASFLGVGVATVRRLIERGHIRAFSIPNLTFGTRMIRIRIEELNRLITDNDLTGGLTGRNRSHWINPHTCRKIPVALASRILGMTGSAVSEAIYLKTLDPTPEGLHEYILHRSKKELTTQIRAKYRSKIYALHKKVHYYKHKNNGKE